jgi:hypothetical protein
MKNAYKVLDGKPEGRRVLLESQPLGSHRLRGENNIKINLGETVDRNASGSG